jgi:hypothetical protein
MTNRNQCPRFNGCNANLCPRDPGLAKRTWYPDEDICRSQPAPGWVKAQRKLKRRTGHLGVDAGYWLLEMLERGCRIKKGTRGLDPSPRSGWNEPRQLADWLERHPPLVVSDEIREASRVRAIESGLWDTRKRSV